MHKVTRVPEPSILKENRDNWTADLLEQIREKGEYSKVEDKFKNRYNQEDVKELLKQMYNEQCCYCEGRIGDSGYGRIEHLRPKSREEFYQLHFEWTNLHWCCEICNTNKGTKWDQAYPILDPTEDDPEEHLQFFIDMVVAKSKEEKSRGQTTIEHPKLNREELVKARQRIRTKVERIIQMILSEGESPKKESLRDELLLLAEGEEYCTYIRYLIHEFLDRN